MSRKKFTPDQIRDVLKQISSLNLTLVGGQAVNLLAYHYRKPGLEWDKELPFTSEDLDLLGGKLEAVAIQSHCGGKIRHADVEHAGPNSAVILIPMEEGSLRIDVLKYICGPSPEDINRNAIEIHGKEKLRGIKLRVIHPIHGLESKAACLQDLCQTGRQDAKHLRLSVLIAKGYLAEKLNPVREFFNAAERIFSLAGSERGLYAFVCENISIEKAIPLEILSGKSAFKEFLSLRIPQLQKDLATKRLKYIQIQKRIADGTIHLPNKTKETR